MEEQTKQEAPKVDHKPSKEPVPPVSGPLAQFEAWLYDMLVYKAPFQIPKGGTDWIVKYGPWLALVGGVLTIFFVVPTFLWAISAVTYTNTLAMSYGISTIAVGPIFYISLVVLAVQIILLFLSIPLLLKRQRRGWLLMFYSSVISVVYTVFNTFSYGFFNFGTLLMGLIGAAIGFYVIFQIRSYYKS